MKKMSLFLIMACVLSFTSIGISNTVVHAAENGDHQTKPTKPTLTEQQRAELAAMHKEVMEKEKAIVEKYVEFGVMSKQNADMLKNHMDKRFERIQANGYIPPHPFGGTHPGKPPHENSPGTESNE